MDLPGENEFQSLFTRKISKEDHPSLFLNNNSVSEANKNN